MSQALTFYEHKLIHLRVYKSLEYKEIADLLVISPNTVRNNFQYIYKKLSNVVGMPISCMNQLDSAYGTYIYKKNINLEKLREMITKTL